jgi:ACR3 family arsenite transporter
VHYGEKVSRERVEQNQIWVYAAGLLMARAFGLATKEGRALVFTGATRNSLFVLPLALALPAAFDLTPAVVVTQTLVELAGLLVYVRLVPAWLLPGEPA